MKNRKCTKCNKIKSINDFPKNRKGKKYEYTFSYCKDCRRKQLYDNLNNNFDAYLKDRYNRWKNHAKHKGITFKLTFKDIEDLWQKQEGLCFYTDQKITWGVGNRLKSESLSLDKIIPEKGYVKENVVLCINKFNTIKNNLTLDELKIYIPIFYNKIVNCKWIKI